MAFRPFLPIDETGVAYRQEPEDGRCYHADQGQDTEPGNAVEDSVQTKPAPLLAGEEIHGREEKNAEIYHVATTSLSVWFVYAEFAETVFNIEYIRCQQSLNRAFKKG